MGQTPGGERNPLGITDYLTWQSRAVRLKISEDDDPIGDVRLMDFGQGEKLPADFQSDPMMPFVKRKTINSNDFFCLGVDYQREPELTLESIKELGVSRILTRLKLWEMDTLDALKEFLLKCDNQKVTLKILQDRENVEDLELFQKNIETIFSTLGSCVDIFEIGSIT